MQHTPEQVKAEILKLPTFSDDLLIHYWKVISSRSSAAETKLYAPLASAIERERKKRKPTPEQPHESDLPNAEEPKA